MPKRISKTPQEDEYTTIKVPNDLIVKTDCYIGKNGYKSRSEIVKEALRDFFATHKLEASTSPLPRFERINGDANGVLIFDRELKGNKAVHVTFKPTGIRCDYHETDKCEHIEYALGLADVQELIRKKRKEGWKLPDEI